MSYRLYMKTKMIKYLVFSSAAVFAGALPFSRAADLPQRSGGEFRGMYQILSSNDPVFPMNENQEWFLDFGSGIQPGRSGGSVAVSLRQNPNVKVRIMAWQYFPKKGQILIGNPFAEGAGKAVARGVWDLQVRGDGVIFKRGNYQVIMHRADPADY
jgi:hypothetical protein